jgi:hypothetical protein
MRTKLMKSNLIAALLPLFVMTLSCKLIPTASNAMSVTSLRFAPSAFDSFKRNTEMKYSLGAPSTVTITIIKRDSSNRDYLVKTLGENLRETKGSHSITWLGDTDQHLFAPAGVYFGVLHIREQQYETVVQVFHF